MRVLSSFASIVTVVGFVTVAYVAFGSLQLLFPVSAQFLRGDTTMPGAARIVPPIWTTPVGLELFFIYGFAV